MSPQKSQENRFKVALGVISVVGSMLGSGGAIGTVILFVGDGRYAQKPDLQAVRERVVVLETRFPVQGSADVHDSLRRVSTVGK